jgi:UDP-N-acetylmuramoyl-tripeptide--D-alanyl-D-alanine ligase
MIRGVCTDSRRVQQGDVFFALAGERFDAHSFLPEVVQRASAVVVARTRPSITSPNAPSYGSMIPGARSVLSRQLTARTSPCRP